MKRNRGILTVGALAYARAQKNSVVVGENGSREEIRSEALYR